MFRALRSVRARLTLWYTLILLTTLLIFGVLAYTYTSQNLASNLDRSLSHEVRWVKNFIETKAAKVKPSRKYTPKKKNLEPPLPETTAEDDTDEPTDADDEIWNHIYEHAVLNPKKTLIEVHDPKGATVFRSYSVGVESLMTIDVPPGAMKILTVGNKSGEELRVAAVNENGLRIFVAYPLAELTEALENLFSIFLILIPIAMAVSIGGGWFLANKSLRPVDTITKTARQITAQNLDQRIPYHGVDDEIGRLVATINEMIARLRESFEQVKQFSMDASHELRTPLTIMRGEMELALRNPDLTDDARLILNSTLEETLRLSVIVDNLLLLSRADRGQYEISFKDVNLTELFVELSEDAGILAEKKKIEVDVVRQDAVNLKGDEIRLRQLFLNLVDNAIKYTPPCGRIWLSLERENGEARFVVKDNGIGIPKEEHKRIFDRFYRVDKARSREMGGSGLGLAISKWIAELHGGRIDVESDRDAGSTFRVHLPLST